MPDCLDLGEPPQLAADDFLYRWVHPQHIENGVVLPAHCQTKHWREGLSCDWSSLCSPYDTATRKGGALPTNVIRISIRDCNDLGLDIRYCPVIDQSHADANLAHCLLSASDPSKRAIAVLREEFLRRAEVVTLRHCFPHCLLAIVSRFGRRRRSVLRLVRTMIAQHADTEGTEP